jgi:hypothetical protein
MLERMTKDAKFINAFPGFGKFIRNVVYSKRGGCGCGGRKQARPLAKKSGTFRKKVVDHNGLKRHIAALPPSRQAELKRIIGVQSLKVAYKRADRKVVVTTI